MNAFVYVYTYRFLWQWHLLNAGEYAKKKNPVRAVCTCLTERYLIRQRNVHRFLRCTCVGLHWKIKMEPHFENFGIWSTVVSIRTSRSSTKEICILSTKFTFAFRIIATIKSSYLSTTLLLFLAVTWFRPLDCRLCPRRAGFGPRQVHIRQNGAGTGFPPSTSFVHY